MQFRGGELGGRAGREGEAFPPGKVRGVGARAKPPHPAMGASEGEVDIILYLDSGKCLDKVNETCLKQLQNISKTFHPLYLAISPHPMQSTTVGGPSISPSTIMESTTVRGCRRRPPLSFPIHHYGIHNRGGGGRKRFIHFIQPFAAVYIYYIYIYIYYPMSSYIILCSPILSGGEAMGFARKVVF